MGLVLSIYPVCLPFLKACIRLSLAVDSCNISSDYVTTLRAYYPITPP